MYESGEDSGYADWIGALADHCEDLTPAEGWTPTSTVRVIANLREALRPLAWPYAYGEPKDPIPEFEIDCCVSITHAHVRAAREALGGEWRKHHA